MERAEYETRKAELQAERTEAIEHLTDYAKGTPGHRQAQSKVSWLNEKLYRLEDERKD